MEGGVGRFSCLVVCLRGRHLAFLLDFTPCVGRAFESDVGFYLVERGRDD